MKNYQPYPGTRDFYPSGMNFHNWLFEVQRKVCKLYGYEEYSAPILEFTDLYRSKSSEEIVNDQLYTFIDRGNREVSIRPEMTPTLARMIATRQTQFIYPLRWFSIANFMRYERPGKGRLREFYQLNVDLIGSDSIYSDVEILSIAIDILKAYGAKEDDFIIRYSHRKLLDLWMDFNDSIENKEKLRKIGRLLDKREKITEEEFEKALKEICNDEEIKKIRNFLSLNFKNYKEIIKNDKIGKKEEILSIFENFINIIKFLESNHNARNLIFDPSIVRGFDYYTGIIFEIYDNHPENRRAIFGGGRYDKLIGQFGKLDLPAIGFGMGDVTLESFLRIHHLVPEFKTKMGFYLALFDETLYEEYLRIASILRKGGLPVEISLQKVRKIGKEFEHAQKKGFDYVLIMGEEEFKNELIQIKNLKTGKQFSYPINQNEIQKTIENLKNFIN